jgi:CBS domain-containing protein
MAAMFSGASRAFLTAVIFSLETTQQPHLLLPLLGGCAAAYFISFIMMRSTIMTEKISRRGINTPDSYMPDVLNSFLVKDVLKDEVDVLSANDTIAEVREFIDEPVGDNFSLSYAVVDDKDGDKLLGIVSIREILSSKYIGEEKLITLLKGHAITINEDDNLHKAIDKMVAHNVEILPVVTREDKHTLKGILTHRQVLEAFEIKRKESENKEISISVRERVFLRGKRLLKK